MQELDKLQEDNLPVKIVKQIEVREPYDYNDLKEEVRFLKTQNRKYKQAIKYAGISDLAVLIEDFKTCAINKMRLITAEAIHNDYDREQIQNVKELLSFLDELRVQIQEIVAIHEDGKIFSNPTLGPIFKQIDTIQLMLSDKPKIQTMNKRSLCDLQAILTEFSGKLEDSFKKVRRIKASDDSEVDYEEFC